MEKLYTLAVTMELGGHEITLTRLLAGEPAQVEAYAHKLSLNRALYPGHVLGYTVEPAALAADDSEKGQRGVTAYLTVDENGPLPQVLAVLCRYLNTYVTAEAAPGIVKELAEFARKHEHCGDSPAVRVPYKVFEPTPEGGVRVTLPEGGEMYHSGRKLHFPAGAYYDLSPDLGLKVPLSGHTDQSDGTDLWLQAALILADLFEESTDPLFLVRGYDMFGKALMATRLAPVIKTLIEKDLAAHPAVSTFHLTSEKVSAALKAVRVHISEKACAA